MHFIQVFRCARKTGIVPDTTELVHIGFGTMNGKDGKPFKTRDGGVMRLEYLLKEIDDEMLNKIKENQKEKEKKPENRSFFSAKRRQPADASLIYGRDFDDEPIELSQVVTEMGEITIHGKVISFDTREIRNEKTIVMYAVTDFTDTIVVKMFVRNDQLPDILAEIKPGHFKDQRRDSDR